jgi:hypothetical protein
MKILYIYHDKYGRRNLYKKEMEKAGNIVTSINLNDIHGPQELKQSDFNDYDIIWLLDPQYLEEINSLSEVKKPLVTYSSFNPKISHLDQNHIWTRFDFFFCQHYDFTVYLQDIGVNAYYIPIGFYRNQYYPIINSRKTMGISFAGHISKAIYKYLDILNDFDIKIFGEVDKDIPLSPPKYYLHEEQNDIYSKSKINLDIPLVNGISLYNDVTTIKNRFFEIPASNQFLLTMKTDEALNIFDETMVGYYTDMSTLIESISRYIKDDRLRKRMAEKSYKEVISKHTFSHRFDHMFKILKGE